MEFHHTDWGSPAAASGAAVETQPGERKEHQERNVLELRRAWLGGVQPVRRAEGVACGLVAASPLLLSCSLR